MLNKKYVLAKVANMMYAIGELNYITFKFSEENFYYLITSSVNIHPYAGLLALHTTMVGKDYIRTECVELYKSRIHSGKTCLRGIYSDCLTSDWKSIDIQFPQEKELKAMTLQPSLIIFLVMK